MKTNPPFPVYRLTDPVLEVGPIWGPLRTHPHFQALLGEHRDDGGCWDDISLPWTPKRDADGLAQEKLMLVV